MELWQKHTTNITWDTVIAYHINTAYDVAQRLVNMGPTGNEAIIDATLCQTGRFRPTPELSNYRTPIKSLYATGGAWHPGAGANCWSAYACYKVIAEDLGFGKPWQDKGRAW